jgi:hypothetical protein
MQFKDFFYKLDEIFNNPAPIKWSETNNSRWKGEFIINNKKYIINFIKIDQHAPWEIVFDLIQNKRKTQDITGTGDEFQVFSTVLGAIKLWLNKTNPSNFILSAREPSRQSLYRKMLQFLPRKTWNVEDLGSSFYVQNKLIKQPVYSGYSDSDFDDYFDDEY